MKLFHLSDLHLGKRERGFSLIEDQAHILGEIVRLADAERPQAVLIAGDVYDQPVPPAEAVRLLDDFLVRLSEREIAALLISGNHDSPERVAFGARLMAQSGVRVAPVYDGSVAPVTLRDEYGEVDFFLLPFIKPAHVRRFYPDERIESYTDALRVAIAHMSVEPSKRSVLVTHQFVTGASQGGSEETGAYSVSVGGADNVDASVFAPFDYVALGHIHKPQPLGGQTVRYCGAPLKYSLSEIGQQKSLTVVTLGEKGDVRADALPLAPLRDMRELRGGYMDLTAKPFYEGTRTDDYLRVVLTDENEIPDAIGRLSVIYPNVMALEYDNRRTRSAAGAMAPTSAERKTPVELFSELYERQNNQPLSEEQRALLDRLIAKVWEASN